MVRRGIVRFGPETHDVTTRQIYRASLALLGFRDRVVLGLLVAAQGALALLDLLGIAILGLFAALSTATATGQPAPAVDRIISWTGIQITSTWVLLLAAFAGILLVLKSIVSLAVTSYAFRLLAKREALIASRLATELMRQPLVVIQGRSSQETAYALNGGVGAAVIGVLGGATLVASEVVLIVVLILGLLLLDPPVAIYTLIFFSLVGGILHRILSGWAERLGSSRARTSIASLANTQEALRSYREITVSGRREFYIRRFEVLRWQFADVEAGFRIMGLISKYVFEIALVVGGGLLAVSQLALKDAPTAVAVIAVFFLAASRMMPSLLRLQTAALGMRSAASEAMPALVLARDLGDSPDCARGGSMDTLRRNHSRGLAQGHTEFSPDLRIVDVNFTFPGASRPALSSVSLSVPAGGSLALVGPTGAGKTTLADVILGVIAPDSGEVLIGSIPPASAVEVFPGAIAYVPQEIALATTTVRENVALGLPDDMIDDDRVWQALERAHLADLMRNERDGLDTVVGEHGVRLSGGQRQRLGIARALYTSPRLLVLDEATSALDAETEHSIADTMRDLEGVVTLVVVAHRLATIRHCEQVCYLHGGHVAALGTFDHVRKQSAHFERQASLLGL